MIEANKQTAVDFFAALTAGKIPDELLTPDFSAWTTTRGDVPGAAYQGGVAMFGTLFPDRLVYRVDTLIAEADRVAAEVRAQGTLVNGQFFANTYVFILTLRDGRIRSVAEHFNPQPVTELVMPLLRSGAPSK